MQQVAQLDDVLTKIQRAHKRYLLEKANHPAPSLIAVSKTHASDVIEPLLQHGHRAFGENRVQEAQEKWVELKETYDDVELHLIGPLQTNKAKEAVALFDVIETVDREKLARSLKKEMDKQNRHLPCFIQVNTGEEPQKAGILPNETKAFVKLCRDELGLNVIGLMCIPPTNDPAALHFEMLKQLAAENNLAQLSMGMSNDYELATAMGATHVRVGSAIFGERG